MKLIEQTARCLLVTMIFVWCSLLAEASPLRLTYDGPDCAPTATTLSQAWVYLCWSKTQPDLTYLLFRKGRENYGWQQAASSLQRGDTPFWYPAMYVMGMYVYVVYASRSTGDWEIYFLKSTNFGGSWVSPVRMTDSSGLSIMPNICGANDNLYLVWCDDTSGKMEVYARISSDRGESWSLPIKISSGGDRCQQPMIACDALGNAHIVWSEEQQNALEVVYIRYDYVSQSWSSPLVLSPLDGFDSCMADIACADVSEHLYVVWQDARSYNWEVYCRISGNRGVSWAGEVVLSALDGDDSFSPRVASKGTDVAVIWRDDSVSPSAIFYRQSQNNGTNWSGSQSLSTGAGEGSFPEVVPASNSWHFLWSEKTGLQWDIFYEGSIQRRIETAIKPGLWSLYF